MSMYSLGKAIITIEGEDTCIKLDASKVDMEVVDDVFQHQSEFPLVPDRHVIVHRSVILRCEFTEDMVVTAADPSATKKVVDSSMIKKVVNLVRVIRLKK